MGACGKVVGVNNTMDGHADQVQREMHGWMGDKNASCKKTKSLSVPLPDDRPLKMF